VFPEIPDRHIFQILKITWESTHRLADDPTKVTQLPANILNVPPFRTEPEVHAGGDATIGLTPEELKRRFDGYRDPFRDPLLQEDLASITNSQTDFFDCCEQLLSLRSFFNYSGECCPSAVPRNQDGSFDLSLAKERTREVGRSLKDAVN
jgi:hypothetical protein